MLEQLSKHSLIDLAVRAKGDLHIDFHHTTEDTGIAIGEAVNKALGDRAGITRYGSAQIPLDEGAHPGDRRLFQPALPGVEGGGSRGPSWARWTPNCSANGSRPSPRPPASRSTSTTSTARTTTISSKSAYKALARALRQAVAIDARAGDAVPSTKGVLSDTAKN